MPLPTPDQYNEAVQAPRLAFTDSLLQKGEVERNALGLPLALGGSFAITYRIHCKNKKSYAVRCFHKSTADLDARYDQIHRALGKARLSYFVEFEYQHQGMRVRGAAYPIVKMEWAEGETLGPALENSYEDKKRLGALQRHFEDLEEALRKAGLAHGDLQNGNVIVERSGLRLVDYDGMFVPGMARGNGVEIGHKHFQHPGRTAKHFGPEMDRFSFIVLDLSFDALRLEPELYEKFGSGENLLFTANDFMEPEYSTLFQALARLPDEGVRTRAENFARICAAPIEEVPTLKDFRSGLAIPSKRAAVSRPAAGPVYIGAFPVVDAADWERTPADEGDRVEIVGQVLDVKVRSSKKGTTSLALLLGDRFEDAVRVEMWEEALRRFAAESDPDQAWEGRWVSITGLMGSGPSRKRRRWRLRDPNLAIAVDDPTQVTEIGRDEARWRLGRGPKPAPGTKKRRGNKASNRQVLDTLKKGLEAARAAAAMAAAAASAASRVPSATKMKNKALLQRMKGTGPATPAASASASSPSAPAPAPATPPAIPAGTTPAPAWIAGANPAPPAQVLPAPARTAGPTPAALAPPSPTPSWMGGGTSSPPRWGRRYWITVGATLLGLLLLGIVLRAIVR